MEAVELATLEWVHWFNQHSLLEPIEYIPPAEAEANYYRQLASQTAVWSGLTQTASAETGRFTDTWPHFVCSLTTLC